MRLCVFCGSSNGRDPRYVEAARDLGRVLADGGHGLVYGGAGVGLMGALADSALAAGVDVVGVIPQHLVDREIAHPGLTTIKVVADMHERKATMADLSDAFLALPGGAGTLEELFEVWTWGHLGLHTKPVGVLDVAGFYQPMADMVEHLVAEGFMSRAFADSLLVDADARRLLHRLAT